MPYIKKSRRKWLSSMPIPQSPGELNYAITRLIHQYIKTKGEEYQSYNDVLGALEGAKLELYRKCVAPYEDKKCIENGELNEFFCDDE